jgi:sugar lactone lactonase YvrE
MHRRLSLFLGASLALFMAAPISAAAFPARIDLPDGWRPEGITSSGTIAYVGSMANGAVRRVDLTTGDDSTIVVGGSGQVAVGVEYEEGADRLWVAGGDTGTVRAYDAITGAPLATYQFGPVPLFLNDLVATDEAIYVTDSLNQRLIVIPLGSDGSLPAPTGAQSLPITGELVYEAGFNANGIVESRGWLIVVQSNTGELFRIDPGTGVSHEIGLGGESVTNGDGLELVGATLYVVRNRDEIVAVFRLGAGLGSASMLGEITAAPDDLDVPTTATFAAGRLWAVNARFGTDDPDTADYWITQLPAQP